MAIAVFSGMFAVGAARADDRIASFTTFLREGPGLHYRVVDEIVTGQVVDVATCDDSWCRLRLDRSTGFVPKGALTMPQAAPTFANKTCFLNRGNGARVGVPEQFCYDASAKR